MTGPSFLFAVSPTMDCKPTAMGIKRMEIGYKVSWSKRTLRTDESKHGQGNHGDDTLVLHT